MIINSILPTNRHIKRNICISNDCRYKIIERFNRSICLVINNSNNKTERKIFENKLDFDKLTKENILYRLYDNIFYNEMSNDIISDIKIIRSNSLFTIYMNNNNLNILIRKNNKIKSIPIISNNGKSMKSLSCIGTYNLYEYIDKTVALNIHDEKLEVFIYPKFNFLFSSNSGYVTINKNDYCYRNNDLIDKINEKIKPDISYIFDVK